MRSISTSAENYRLAPFRIDTRSMLKDKHINYVWKNTDEFLNEDEIDIHGLSNLCDHKIIRFKYPQGMS